MVAPRLDAPSAPRYPFGMAKKTPNLADLRRAGTITSVEIAAAITAYMSDPECGPYRFASGHSLCVSEVTSAVSGLAGMSSGIGPHEKSKRVVVATAIMAACPTPPEDA